MKTPTPILIKTASFFWRCGILATHILSLCLFSSLIFGSTAPISLGAMLTGAIVLIQVEGGYTLYRKVFHRAEGLGLLRPLWSLPQLLYEINTKKQIERKREMERKELEKKEEVLRIDEYLRQEGVIL